jgi:hypothetical protein
MSKAQFFRKWPRPNGQQNPKGAMTNDAPLTLGLVDWDFVGHWALDIIFKTVAVESER